MVLNRPIHHIGFAVRDLADAARHWATALGAGPFYSLGEVVFDEMSAFGKPCIFNHSAAFGQWGNIIVEIQKIDDCKPEELRRLQLPGKPSVLNHISYVSENPEADSAQLDAAGFKSFMYAKVGEIELRFHDAKAQLGYAIEIQRASDFLTHFTTSVKEASLGWDGQNPLRLISDIL